MNIMNKVTFRHLKENKRRTLVTIIGVIISVAMITAVATLSVSFLDLMVRNTIADEGEWHVQYKNVNQEQFQEIEKDGATEKVILVRERGYANIPGAENESKPYLFFKEYNELGLKDFPIQLKEGRLPQKANEVVVSEEIIKNHGADFEIGKEITIEIGDRYIEGSVSSFTQNTPLKRDETGIIETLQIKETATFTIVGTISRPVWENLWSPAHTVVGYVDEALLSEGGTADVAVTVKKLNNSLYEHAEELAEKTGIEKYSFHDELLRYYGVTDNDNLRNVLYSLAAIIMTIIIIGSVALIYNAFAISVSERARHLGMLSSVGATKKQKRNSVFFEGAIIGAISIPIGIMAGVGGIAVTFLFINSNILEAMNLTEQLKVVVTPSSILVASLVSLLTIFISTYMPARKASRISPIDAIRQTQDVKLTGKAVKTSKLIRKIFGIEPEIGLKNLKRNRRRYRATVFSLVISIVLFLTVSFFTENLRKSLDLSQEDINFDISVSGYNQLDEDDLMPLTKMDGITDWSMTQEVNLSSLVTKTEIPEKLKETMEHTPKVDGRYPYYVLVYSLDEESLLEYAKRVGVNAEDLTDPDHPSAIVINDISYYDYGARKFIETKAINKGAGDTFELFDTNYDDDSGEENYKYINEIEIAATTGEMPMGINNPGPGGVYLIVSEKTMSTILERLPKNEAQTSLFMESTDPLATQEAIEEFKTQDMYIYNLYERRQQSEQLILMMSIFTYGFIVLISLISIANIFNTISTSISLRKREFAMLRSVGMTPKGFNKMMNYESAFYGIKALLYGLPISFAVMFLIYRAMNDAFEYGFNVPWSSVLLAIAAIFIIVGTSMLYSTRKIKRENIIEALKQENI